MAYTPYYAPYSRPMGYYNPSIPQQDMQTNQQMPVQQPIQQMPMQTPTSFVPTQPTNDMIFVLNETEATAFPVAPNNSVTLWDKNKDTVYIKSVNMQGVPSMRILDYTERTAEGSKTPEKHVCNCSKEFVPLTTFNALVERIDVLSAKVKAITETPKPEAPKAKAKVKEETDNG